MKRNAALKNDFFDPASLAEDEDTPEIAEAPPAPATSAAPEAADVISLEEPHRLLGEFQDPLAELNAVPPEVPGAFAAPAVPSSGEWAETNGHHEHQARAELAETLFRLVLCDLSFVELNRIAVTAIAQAVDADCGGLLELDRRAQELFFRAASGEGSESLTSVRLPADGGFVGAVANSRTAELVQDAGSDPRFQRVIGAMSGTPVRNAMAAPILVAGELFGVLEVLNKRGGGAFSDFDLRTLERAAAMLAKVLEVRFFSAAVIRHV